MRNVLLELKFNKSKRRTLIYKVRKFNTLMNGRNILFRRRENRDMTLGFDVA